jgi:hypothetical protein
LDSTIVVVREEHGLLWYVYLYFDNSDKSTIARDPFDLEEVLSETINSYLLSAQ